MTCYTTYIPRFPLDYIFCFQRPPKLRTSLGFFQTTFPTSNDLLYYVHSSVSARLHFLLPAIPKLRTSLGFFQTTFPASTPCYTTYIPRFLLDYLSCSQRPATLRTSLGFCQTTFPASNDLLHYVHPSVSSRLPFLLTATCYTTYIPRFLLDYLSCFKRPATLRTSLGFCQTTFPASNDLLHHVHPSVSSRLTFLLPTTCYITYIHRFLLDYLSCFQRPAILRTSLGFCQTTFPAPNDLLHFVHPSVSARLPFLLPTTCYTTYIPRFLLYYLSCSQRPATLLTSLGFCQTTFSAPNDLLHYVHPSVSARLPFLLPTTCYTMYIPDFVLVVGLLSLSCWDRGFESRRGHGYLSVVSVVCCRLEILASNRSLVHRNPADSSF